MTSPPDRPQNIREIAELLIAHLGERATCHASYRALRARQQGELRKMEAWRWIAGATRDILRAEPHDAESMSG